MRVSGSRSLWIRLFSLELSFEVVRVYASLDSGLFFSVALSFLGLIVNLASLVDVPSLEGIFKDGKRSVRWNWKNWFAYE